MSQSPYSYPLTGGMDLSVAPAKANPAGFHLLKNIRPSRTDAGQLEQTPYFKLVKQYDRGTYWHSGSSTTEDATSNVRLVVDTLPFRRYVVTDKVVWSGSTTVADQLRVFDQSVTTTGTGLNSLCLLVINSVGGLAINLGGALDVQIDSATTFRWRKNGGAWTSLVPITTLGVSIDGGNATVYFQTDVGFTANDIWTWTRYDSVAESAAGTDGYTSHRNLRYVIADSDLFFLAPSGRVFKIATDSAPQPFCISVGYRPIYGRDITEFANHLFLVGGLESVPNTAPYAARVRFMTQIAWSDRGNFDNFFSTDVNEADVKDFNRGALAIDTGSSLNPQVYGFFVVGTRIFVVCREGFYTSSYIGLPDVFNFEFVTDIANPIKLASGGTGGPYVVRAEGQCIFVCHDSIYSFDGATFKDIGRPIASLIDNQHLTSAVWLAGFQELVLQYDTVLYICQFRTGLWHSRVVNTATATYCLAFDYYMHEIVLCGASRNVSTEDTDFSSSAPLFDASTAFAPPEIQFQLVHDGWIHAVKEIVNSWITARSATVAGTGYEAGVLTPTWADSTDGSYPTAWTAFLATYTTATCFGDLREPRGSFRAFALRLIFTTSNLSSKAPARLLLSGVELVLQNMAKQEVRR